MRSLCVSRNFALAFQTSLGAEKRCGGKGERERNLGRKSGRRCGRTAASTDFRKEIMGGRRARWTEASPKSDVEGKLLPNYLRFHSCPNWRFELALVIAHLQKMCSPLEVMTLRRRFCVLPRIYPFSLSFNGDARGRRRSVRPRPSVPTSASPSVRPSSSIGRGRGDRRVTAADARIERERAASRLISTFSPPPSFPRSTRTWKNSRTTESRGICTLGKEFTNNGARSRGRAVKEREDGRASERARAVEEDGLFFATLTSPFLEFLLPSRSASRSARVRPSCPIKCACCVAGSRLDRGCARGARLDRRWRDLRLNFSLHHLMHGKYLLRGVCRRTGASQSIGRNRALCTNYIFKYIAKLSHKWEYQLAKPSAKRENAFQVGAARRRGRLRLRRFSSSPSPLRTELMAFYLRGRKEFSRFDGRLNSRISTFLPSLCSARSRSLVCAVYPSVW